MAKRQTKVISEEAAFPGRSGSFSIPERELNAVRRAVVMIKTSRMNGSGSIILLQSEDNPCLLTCHHVLSDAEVAKNCQIYFERVEGEGQPVQGMDFLDTKEFYSHKNLDFTIVPVNAEILKSFGRDAPKPMPLRQQTLQVNPHDTAYIIHHPDLQGFQEYPMCRCVNSCEIFRKKFPVIAHHLHTAKGSSGSPLFKVSDDGRLHMVGLHCGVYPAAPEAALFNVAIDIGAILETYEYHLNHSTSKEFDLEEALADIKDDLRSISNSRAQVKVERIPQHWGKEELTMTFDCQEDGEIIKIKMDQSIGTAFITYSQQRTAERVAALKIWMASEYELAVSLHQPPPDPLEASLERFNVRTTLILSDIPPEVVDEHLQLYVAKETGLQEQHFEIERDPSASFALLVVPRDGIERVYRCLKDTKRAIILERFLAVHRFPPVTSVCIKRPKRDLLNSSKEDYLRLYFENKKKSGGGPVSEIKHITKEKTIIVTFKYADVVNEVVARDHSHILGDEAELCRYHPLLSGHGYKHPAKITVKKENLENIQADVYINSAPSSLELHHGPLCQSLSEAGGPELQAACLDYVVKHGKVKAGSVAVTVGAKLKCKNVVHVVGKEYDGPGGSADRYLEKCLNKAMECCEQLRASTVAIPAIGTGVNKFPLDTAARIIHSVANSALTKTKSIKEVILVAQNDKMYYAFLGQVRAQ